MKYISSTRLLAASVILVLSLAFAVPTQAKPKTAANEVTVTGTVTDEKGEPVAGAIVFMKGTSNGSSTDRYGKYSVSVPADAVLVFSSIGYKDKKVEMNGKSVLDVTLDFENDPINDEEEIGYGTRKKVLATNATLQVKGSDITKLSTTSALGALQSQTPGVAITSNSGQPGQGYNVNIRGVNTLWNSAPLYVIDGIPGGDINALNPSDIESVEVLKDAASAAIYGSRAANGVILVTTKRGKEGRTVVSYDGYVGTQYLPKMPDVCDAQGYMQLQDELSANTAGTTYDWDSQLPESLLSAVRDGKWNGTNWIKEMYNKGALTHNHALNVTGGSADHNFSAGVTYTAQDGTLGKNEIESVYSKYKRITFRANSDHVAIKSRNKDFDILKFGETFTFSMGQNNGLAEGGIDNNSIHNALSANPLIPVYKYNDVTGGISGFFDRDARKLTGWNFDNATKNPNPIAQDVYTNGSNLNKYYTLNTNLYVQVEPIKNLKLKSQFGYNLSANDYRFGTKKYALSDFVFNDYEKEYQDKVSSQKFIWENTISYHLDIQKHAIDIMAGQSFEKSKLDVKDETTKNRYEPEFGLVSFFGRIGYNYDERYILSAMFRTDATSTHNLEERVPKVFYPSVSAGWVISNERWMKPASNWLSLLKLRASWGRNGSTSLDYLYHSSLSATGTMSYWFDKSYPSGGTIPVIFPPLSDVVRETTDQTDIGLDAGFFDNRLRLSADWYVKTTKDLIHRVPSMYGSEAYSLVANVGDIRNSGVEFSLGWGERRGEFTYNINLNGAWNRNEVLRINRYVKSNESSTYFADGIIHGEENALYPGSGENYRIQEGEPIGFFYGYKTAGVWQTQDQIVAAREAGQAVPDNAQPGDLIYVDANGDGKINSDDRTKIGDPNPDFTAGLNISFGYRGFDLGIAGYGAFGHQIAKSYRTFTNSAGDNFSGDMFGRWHGEGTSNRFPRLADSQWSKFSDIYVENGDYFKISNITLGYDFKKLIKTPVISRLRLYFAVQNPFTFTKYSGMDPEVTYRGGESWASGIDIGYYPNPRTFLMGLNIQF